MKAVKHLEPGEETIVHDCVLVTRSRWYNHAGAKPYTHYYVRHLDNRYHSMAMFKSARSAQQFANYLAITDGDVDKARRMFWENKGPIINKKTRQAYCPDCGKPMHKRGFTNAGTQQYSCYYCGKQVINKQEKRS